MFRPILNSKIGELLNFLATEVSYLSLTKALKLLYLIDEHAVERTGVPVTWLDYKVWEKGPVAPEIYHEIKHQQSFTFNSKPLSLEAYVKVARTENPNRNNQEEIYLHSGKAADLSEFSEQEQEIINEVVVKYGKLNAIDLIELLHSENTLWDRLCKQNQLQFDLFKKTSNVSIDFYELIKEDGFKQMAAQAAYESLLFQEKLLEQ